MMKHAEHPAAAVVFVDFLLTDGQKVLNDGHRIIASVMNEGDPVDSMELIEAPEEDLLVH
jgi:iron(III) transport system substrate-binding protein